MTESCGHDHTETRFRLVGHIDLHDDAIIQVEHVYGNQRAK